MVFTAAKPLHPVGAEPSLQALDQAGQAFVLALRRREELGVGRGARDVFGVQGEFERGRGQLQPRQALAQQGEQVGAVARRLGQRDLERGEPAA